MQGEFEVSQGTLKLQREIDTVDWIKYIKFLFMQYI